jgi:hypothetical protein
VSRSNTNHSLMTNVQKLADRRKQAKLKWLQDLSVVTEDNLSDVRREGSRHFRNNKKGIFAR